MSVAMEAPIMQPTEAISMNILRKSTLQTVTNKNGRSKRPFRTFDRIIDNALATWAYLLQSL